MYLPPDTQLYEEEKESLDDTAEQVRSALDAVEAKILSLYIQTSPDTRRCPAPGCEGAGTISMHPSSEPLTCIQCGYTWRDPVHMSYAQRLVTYVREHLLGCFTC